MEIADIEARSEAAAPHDFENEVMVGCRGDSTILFLLFRLRWNQAWQRQ
jgi:hypothetical protein